MRKSTEGLSNAEGAFRTGLNVSSSGDTQPSQKLPNLNLINMLKGFSISGTRDASLMVVCGSLAETPAEFGEGPRLSTARPASAGSWKGEVR